MQLCIDLGFWWVAKAERPMRAFKPELSTESSLSAVLDLMVRQTKLPYFACQILRTALFIVLDHAEASVRDWQ